MSPTKRQGRDAVPAVLQFKITLIESDPPIWRRILVPDGTLDELHEHIQTAMGWTNSHLHQFEIGGRRYGDLELLDDGWEGDDAVIDSCTTRLSALLARKRMPFRFRYVYDFGDNWEHEVVFEGLQPRRDEQEVPCCLEGARACPPEDVGGLGGYEQFQEAIRDPKHEEHAHYLEWSGGEFNPEAFDVTAATEAMLEGLPSWRDE